MTTEQFSNLAQTTLASSIVAGATSLSVASATGFPASPQFRIVIDQEIFLVTTVSSTTYANPAMQYPSRSPIAWANRFLRARLNCDLTQGYIGQFQAVVSVKVVSGGSGYTAPTVSFSGTGTGLTFGTPVLSGGVITSVPVTAQGINFTALPNLSVSDLTGSGASLQAIIGGTGTFGVAGETTTQCINRLPDIVAAPVDIVFVCIGTNDVTNGVSAATSKANLQKIFDTLIQAGKVVVYCPDQARSYWASLSGSQITSARHQLYNVKRWAYQYALMVNGKNPNTSKRILICDGEDFWVDATSSTGNPLSIMTSDGLHWSTASAQAMGLRLADQLQQLLGLTGAANVVSQADGYDATYNQDGALNFGWLMNATPGTPTSPLTGSIAGDFNAFRSSATSTGTMAGSIETARTDLLSGSRQVFTFSLGSGGSAEVYNFGITNSAISSYNITTGMTIVAECDMWLSNQANVNNLSLAISFNNSGTVVMQGSDGDTGTDVYIASGAYMALSGDSTPMSFRTAPVVVPSTANHFTCYATIGFNASGAAGSATATWKIGNFKIRQVV